MNKRISSYGFIVAAAMAAAIGLTAYRRRPVKPPDSAGTWHPVESQRTKRK